jgi:hypothetical protein
VRTTTASSAITTRARPWAARRSSSTPRARPRGAPPRTRHLELHPLEVHDHAHRAHAGASRGPDALTLSTTPPMPSHHHLELHDAHHTRPALELEATSPRPPAPPRARPTAITRSSDTTSSATRPPTTPQHATHDARTLPGANVAPTTSKGRRRPLSGGVQPLEIFPRARSRTRATAAGGAGETTRFARCASPRRAAPPTPTHPRPHATPPRCVPARPILTGTFTRLSPAARRAPRDPSKQPLMGARGRNRTCDLRFRKPSLYPAELRERGSESSFGSPPFATRASIIPWPQRPP